MNGGLGAIRIAENADRRTRQGGGEVGESGIQSHHQLGADEKTCGDIQSHQRWDDRTR